MKSYDKKIKQLISMYVRAEKRLINIISTKKVKGQVTDFYESMLKQVKFELMQLQLKSADYSKSIVNELYLEAYKNSLNDLGISNIGDGFTQLHTDAINTLSDNIINNFAEVNNQVGRRIEDTIREIGLTNTQMKFASGQTIKQLQNELLDNLINTGLGGITDKRGRVIPFTTYAELLGRSIVAETQNTAVKNVANEHNKDLVKMTSHCTSCPICAKYEGRVYSLSGNDERFPKLNTIPGFSSGYNNIHPRCRHRISVYIEKYNDVDKDIENSNKPFEIPKEKEDSVNKYLEEQKEKARLRNDKKQFERYKEILGEEAPKSLQSFMKMKYNDSERWNIKQREFSTINSINSKNWSDVYKEKVKSTYYDFRKDNVELSWHGSQRFVDRNIDKDGNIVFTKKNIVDMCNIKPNYIQQDGRLVNLKNGIAIIRNSETGEVVSIVVRKKPKEEWIKND